MKKNDVTISIKKNLLNSRKEKHPKSKIVIIIIIFKRLERMCKRLFFCHRSLQFLQREIFTSLGKQITDHNTLPRRQVGEDQIPLRRWLCPH